MFASFPASVESHLAMSIAAYDPDARSVTIIAFDETLMPALVRLARGAGATVADSGLIGDADWDERPFGDVVLIDARGMDAGDAALALPELVQRAAGSGQLLIHATLANLDSILAMCPEDTDILVSASEVELHLALAAALVRSRGGAAQWHDVASEEGLRLQRLADEIGRITRTLIDLPEGLGAYTGVSEGGWRYRGQPPEIAAAGIADAAVTAAEVRLIIRLRRLRERFFAPDLFADPAWDMLLDLAAARIERARVAVSSLCIAAAVPPTTALRWIKAMTDKGLLRRVADPHDARRIFIQLSDDAAAAMEQYLRAARGSGMAI